MLCIENSTQTHNMLSGLLENKLFIHFDLIALMVDR